MRTVPVAVALAALLAAAGCKKSDTSPGPATPDSAVAQGDATARRDTSAPRRDTTVARRDAGQACKAAGPQVVKLKTSDGITLEADLYLGGAAGGPVALLLHMIPPYNDRTNYPASFIQPLVKAGITVLNVDRRGAGKSQGNAKEAYTGPKGWLDARAARDFLAAHACRMDLRRMVIVGASNGTTTALDYTVKAGADAGLELPRALVFLTGGSYTENQNKLRDNLKLLARIPILFVYSTAERAWSAAFKSGAPLKWQFREYPGGAHGTRMFQAKPASINDVVGFIRGAVAPR